MYYHSCCSGPRVLRRCLHHSQQPSGEEPRAQRCRATPLDDAASQPQTQWFTNGVPTPRAGLSLARLPDAIATESGLLGRAQSAGPPTHEHGITRNRMHKGDDHTRRSMADTPRPRGRRRRRDGVAARHRGRAAQEHTQPRPCPPRRLLRVHSHTLSSWRPVGLPHPRHSTTRRRGLLHHPQAVCSPRSARVQQRLPSDRAPNHRGPRLQLPDGTRCHRLCKRSTCPQALRTLAQGDSCTADG